MSLLHVHLSILLATGVVIAYSDHDAFLYFLGKKQLLARERVILLHRLVWAGLIGMITTGLLLLYPLADGLLTYPPFLIKMCLVAALVANASLIGRLAPIASERPFVALTLHEKVVLLASGAVSAACWLGAAYLGYFFV